MRTKYADMKDRRAVAAMIAEAEGRHARRMDEIAEAISESNACCGLRVVLVSGPSSSGKTTFSRRLGDVLASKGLQPVPISIDDYFVEREDTPLNAEGKPDFEAVEAVDLPLLNEQLHSLLEGREVVLPVYDFVSGHRLWSDSPLRLQDNSVMILEGLHALNPRLTSLIPPGGKFRIFISPFTPAESQDGARVSPFDVRLLRRLSRDYARRGKSAEATLEQWRSVRRGEELYVFPFLGEADAVFDSSLCYELYALSGCAAPLLRGVGAESPCGDEARRLLKVLDGFPPVTAGDVPRESLLREFIGE